MKAIIQNFAWTRQTHPKLCDSTKAISSYELAHFLPAQPWCLRNQWAHWDATAWRWNPQARLESTGAVRQCQWCPRAPSSPELLHQEGLHIWWAGGGGCCCPNSPTRTLPPHLDMGGSGCREQSGWDSQGKQGAMCERGFLAFLRKFPCQAHEQTNKAKINKTTTKKKKKTVMLACSY